jgi:hypothetical protein
MAQLWVRTICAFPPRGEIDQGESITGYRPCDLARCGHTLSISTSRDILWERDRQDRAWDEWLNCRDQKSIAADLDVDEATVSRWLQDRKDPEMQPPDPHMAWDVWSYGKTATAIESPELVRSELFCARSRQREPLG